MKKFLVGILLLAFVACEQEELLDVNLADQITDCNVSDDNKTATFEAPFTVIRGDDHRSIGFRVTAQTMSGVNLPIQQVTFVGFQHLWVQATSGVTSEFYQIDGEELIKIVVTFKDNLPSEVDFFVFVEVIDEHKNQLTGKIYECISNFSSSTGGGNDECEDTEFNPNGTDFRVYTNLLEIEAMLRDYQGCAKTFVLTSTGWSIDFWQIRQANGNGLWQNGTSRVATQRELVGDVYPQQDFVAGNSYGLTVSMYDANGNLLDVLDYTFVYAGISNPDCHIDDHRFHSVNIVGNQLVIRTLLEGSGCPSNQMYLEVIDVFSSNLEIASYSLSSNGSMINVNSPTSGSAVLDGVNDSNLEWIVTINGPINSGNTLAVNIREEDGSQIWQVFVTVPGLTYYKIKKASLIREAFFGKKKLVEETS